MVFGWDLKDLQISSFTGTKIILSENWWQKAVSPVSYGFLFLGISENLWWSSLKFIFHKINFYVVSNTMVFLFVVCMVVLFEINTVLQIQDLQICWFTGSIIILPEGNNNTKSHVLFRIGSIWNEKLVLNWRVLNSCWFFFYIASSKKVDWFSKISKNLQICWFIGIKILLSKRNDSRKFEALFHVGVFSE